MGQGQGEGPAEPGGPTLVQPRRSSGAQGPVCAAPWREAAVTRRCGPDAGEDRGIQGAGDTENRGSNRDLERDAERNDRHRETHIETETESKGWEETRGPSDTGTVRDKEQKTQSDTET